MQIMEVKVLVDDQSAELKVNPKIITQLLVHLMAQALSKDLTGWWFAAVLDGIGDDHTYQEGDTIRLYPASQVDLERIQGARTPKGSAALIPKTIGGPPPQKKAPKEKHDWIWELCQRGETPIHDVTQLETLSEVVQQCHGNQCGDCRAQLLTARDGDLALDGLPICSERYQ
jgi:hypothetical protein